MKDKSILKIFVVVLVAILVINIVLLALRKLSEIIFWAIVIMAGIFAYKILPELKK